MKIIVSHYMRRELRTLVITGTFGILFCFIVWHTEDYIIVAAICSSFIVFVTVICQILCFTYGRRLFSHVIYENDTYTSYFGKKKLCTIDSNSPVFYAITYAARVSTTYFRDYILISAEPFQYQNGPIVQMFPWQPKPIHTSYDMQKMIMLPYEENAPYLSKMHEWTRIYPS